jgi:hypothetical protein
MANVPRRENAGSAIVEAFRAKYLDTGAGDWLFASCQTLEMITIETIEHSADYCTEKQNGSPLAA